MLKQYQKDRLTTFLTAPSGVGSSTGSSSNSYQATIEYNLDQSKAAIADGSYSVDSRTLARKLLKSSD